MEQEADFSEPEQVQLVQPVLAVGSALPSTSSTPSPAADVPRCLPRKLHGGQSGLSTSAHEQATENKGSTPSPAQELRAELVLRCPFWLILLP